MDGKVYNLVQKFWYFGLKGGLAAMPRMSKEQRARDGREIQYATIKARLYPTPEQAVLFENTFGCCRYIWNRMLADQQRFYAETDAHFIPTPAKYKKEAPFLKEVDNQALIQEHNRLSQAFRVFFKNPECFGHPNFKRKKDDRDSFTACNHVFESGPTIYITKNGIRMTKAGIVSAKFPRRPRNGWKLKRVTVEKTRTGKYYAYILYEYETKVPEPVVPAPETTLGLKYSMSHFYVSDTGETADAPRWLSASQEKLTKLQRKLSRMQPGSKNYGEAVQKYRLLHEHIANQRRDFIHKQSSRIANGWDAVCMRSDSIQELSKNKALPGNALDSGFGMFRECLRYKLARQGKPLILLDRYTPTSRICSACGQLRGCDLHRRSVWICAECGARHDREVNAAKNIKAQGLEQFFNHEEMRQSA